ncbi:MAG: prepilin peptidase [Hyphomonadaceae bacterium]|nr:prepilin peptidase [Hyphomonadaceae bacterium]
MIESAAVAAYAGLLIYAAASDVTSLTIPNWLSIALAGLYPIAALASGAPLAAVGLHLGFGIAILVIGFALFQFNVLGGGDAKIIAAASVWTGLAAFLPFIFWTAVAGGLIALALVLARHFVTQAETNPAFVNRLLAKQNGIPYGVAIMVGGLCAVPQLPILSHTLTLP